MPNLSDARRAEARRHLEAAERIMGKRAEEPDHRGVGGHDQADNETTDWLRAADGRIGTDVLADKQPDRRLRLAVDGGYADHSV